MTVHRFEAEGTHIEQATIHAILNGTSVALTLNGHWSLPLGLELVNAVESAVASIEGREAQLIDIDWKDPGYTEPVLALEAPAGNPNGPRVAGKPTGRRPGLSYSDVPGVPDATRLTEYGPDGQPVYGHVPTVDTPTRLPGSVDPLGTLAGHDRYTPSSAAWARGDQP